MFFKHFPSLHYFPKSQLTNTSLNSRQQVTSDICEERLASKVNPKCQIQKNGAFLFLSFLFFSFLLLIFYNKLSWNGTHTSRSICHASKTFFSLKFPFVCVCRCTIREINHIQWKLLGNTTSETIDMSSNLLNIIWTWLKFLLIYGRLNRDFFTVCPSFLWVSFFLFKVYT